jgi:thiamine-phosphate pyrophosphorylase
MEQATWRIIDANFNRAREATRVVEEFCRFALNSAVLTRRAKALRHELAAVIGEVDAGRLLASRDILRDVGTGLSVEGQFVRGDLEDCLTAGCKRLTEALRVLGETLQTKSRGAAAKVEKLRYAAYALEKDIAVLGLPAEKFKRVRLYVIITSNLPAEVISLAQKCSSGGADCIQLRAKGMNDDALLAVALEFAQICRGSEVLSVINDRVDVAVAAGADGVHVGQNDLPVEQARRLQLRPLIVGKTTHSVEQLRRACAESPTYVSIGPVFATGTKPDLRAVGLDYVRAATRELADGGIAHVAVGGIGAGNVEDVLRAGARAVAVCSAVSGDRDPARVCRVLKEKISGFASV